MKKRELTKKALRDYHKASAYIQKSFEKQVKLLLEDLHHPSLRAKKYSESLDIWQARVTKGWRFYFKIIDETYLIIEIIPHPK